MKRETLEEAADRARPLRAYLDEVHRRNEESREQRDRLAGSPEVGMFWVVDGRLIILGAWLEEARTTGRFAHYPVPPEKEWSAIQRVGAVPRDTECDDPPRGRVDFDKVTQKFRLYADACILGDEAMVDKIRRDLNLPADILILPDNFYQCSRCLGLSASDFNSSTRRRKRGFAFNREEYMFQAGSLICRALFYYFHARIDDAENTDPLHENEVRRLIDSQLPSWIAIAPTNGRFSRDKAIEEEVDQVLRKTNRTWTTVVKGAARRREADPSTLRPPDRQELETAFFSWVRANCATALQGPKARRTPASMEHVFTVWDHACAALAYSFQNEIARQLSKPASELLLPNRQAIESAFFSRVDDVSAAVLRGEGHEEREPDDER